MKPRLTDITLTFDLAGHTWSQKVDLENTVALCWEEKSMLAILGAYYRAKKRKLTLEEAVKGFGPNAAALFKNRKKRTLSKKLLRELWMISRQVPSPQESAESLPPDPSGMEFKAALCRPPVADLEPCVIGKDPSCTVHAYP
jgi:hypothetical protein